MSAMPASLPCDAARSVVAVGEPVVVVLGAVRIGEPGQPRTSPAGEQVQRPRVPDGGPGPSAVAVPHDVPPFVAVPLRPYPPTDPDPTEFPGAVRNRTRRERRLKGGGERAPDVIRRDGG